MESLTSPAETREAFDQLLIEVFGDLAEIFGNPRSHGQIYGVLFTSTEPLLMEDIAKRSGVSLASASLGLRVLEELGAISRKNHGRIGHYTARYEMKTLISGFIKQRLLPKLKKSNETLRKAEELIGSMTPDDAADAKWKLQRVAQWHARAEQFLPLAEKILESASKLLPKKSTA